MDFTDKVVAITGGAKGIGLAIAQAFAERGARVALADLAGAQETAEQFGGIGMAVDVRRQDDLDRFVRQTETTLGPVDIYVSNAGILRTDAPSWDATGASDEDWLESFDINVMGAVRGARAVVPGMRDRGGGVFILVASAAGLLSQIGAASYTASKHAAVSFAESLAIAHEAEGIRVVCVCPQAVRTDMLGQSEDGGIAGADGIIEPSVVASEILAAVTEGHFFAFPHPRVGDYFASRANNHPRWLKALQKIRKSLMEQRGRPV